MGMMKSNRPGVLRATRVLLCCATLVLMASCAPQEPPEAWQEPEKPAVREPAADPAPTTVQEPPAPEPPEVAVPPTIEPAPPQQAEEPAEPVDFKQYTFRNVRQYFVVNEKEGRILAVEGFVINRSDSAKDFITVEASLFGGTGEKVAAKRSVGGVTVPIAQLESFSREDLESLLHDEVGIFMTNVNIAPGGEVPFMVLFYDPPENVKEFGVRVVEAQETEADQGAPVHPAAGALPDSELDSGDTGPVVQ
ncbi:MAG: DUF3426 domain-containing protein [Oceanidesulfovibrio sp.]